MKMAIVHDAYLHVGGAENVLLELIRIYPNADLFIPIINKKLRSKIEKLTKSKIQTTFFSKIPFFYAHASLLKPLIILYWERLDLAKYNLVISSSHSFNSKLINVNENAVHISYIYTPPRFLSKTFNEIQILNNPVIGFLFAPIFSWLKKKDEESGKKPDLMIGISKEVQKRIKERYKRKSILVYPPVNISSKITKKGVGRYYLFFSRLVKQKGADLAIRTCTKFNIPLLVVGVGPELEKLKKMAGPNIKFKGFLNKTQLEKVFVDTKALINCAIEEDFGMVTIEAGSRGIPTIGFKSGGLIETIEDKKTGIFFRHHTVKSLARAIERFESMTFDKEQCHDFSKKFSTKMFERKIKLITDYYLNK